MSMGKVLKNEKSFIENLRLEPWSVDPGASKVRNSAQQMAAPAEPPGHHLWFFMTSDSPYGEQNLILTQSYQTKQCGK